MIVGSFRDGFLRVSLPLGEDDAHEIEFIVDTGFAGELTLPYDILRQVGAQRIGREPMRLADGMSRLYDLYEVFAEIDDELRPTEVVAIEGDPLLGVAIMQEQRLTADITQDGEMTLEAL